MVEQVKDAMNDAARVGQSLPGKIFDNANPFSAAGRRNLMITTGLAMTGASAAATGVPLPIDVVGLVTASAEEVVTTGAENIATGSFLDGALGWGQQHLGHMWNGGAFLLEEGKELVSGAYDTYNAAPVAPAPAVR